ncbi:MAG: hypothetical protein AB4352_22085 [Hormoscilla sp.]
MLTINNTQKSFNIVSQLVALAWLDKEFYQRLLNNTAEVLREAGVMLEDFAKVVVNQSPTEAPGLRLAAAGGYEICLPPCPAGMASEQLFAAGSEQAPSPPGYAPYDCEGEMCLC